MIARPCCRLGGPRGCLWDGGPCAGSLLGVPSGWASVGGRGRLSSRHTELSPTTGSSDLSGPQVSLLGKAAGPHTHPPPSIWGAPLSPTGAEEMDQCRELPVWVSMWEWRSKRDTPPAQTPRAASHTVTVKLELFSFRCTAEWFSYSYIFKILFHYRLLYDTE